VTMAAGACLGIPAHTAYQAVALAEVVQGSTVLVNGGAGAVAHYAIQLAKKRHAIVITTVSSAAKAEFARRAGADHVIDYRREPATAEITRMLARGELSHNVAQSFALDEIAAAHEAVESSRATGNVVVTLG